MISGNGTEELFTTRFEILGLVFHFCIQREQGKKDPGSGWLCVSQKVGGDEESMGGRCNQVAILSFLNPLWKGNICLRWVTA